MSDKIPKEAGTRRTILDIANAPDRALLIEGMAKGQPSVVKTQPVSGEQKVEVLPPLSLPKPKPGGLRGKILVYKATSERVTVISRAPIGKSYTGIPMLEVISQQDGKQFITNIKQLQTLTGGPVLLP